MKLRFMWTCVLALYACGGGDDDAETGGVVGPEGGTVETEGVELVIPPGALAEEVDIGIAPSGEAAPEGFLNASPVFAFTPDGLEFAEEVEVRFDFLGDSEGLEVVWSTADGDGYELLGGVIDGQQVKGAILHFSNGFAGRADDDGGGGGCGTCPNGLVCVNGQCVAPLPACSDGDDNDLDEAIDGADTGCFSPDDNYETIDCNDGVDNDGDGTIDYTSGTTLYRAGGGPDLGCDSSLDGSERPACSDGVDNDEDGSADDADPDCVGPEDNSEAPPPV